MPTLHAISRVAREARDRDLAIVAEDTARDRRVSDAAASQLAAERAEHIDTWTVREFLEWEQRIARLEWRARIAARTFAHDAQCPPCAALHRSAA